MVWLWLLILLIGLVTDVIIKSDDDHGFGLNIKNAIDQKLEMVILPSGPAGGYGQIATLQYFGANVLVSLAGVDLGWVSIEEIS